MQENCNIKKVKISLIGKNGKMGQMISQLAKDDPFFEISDKGDLIIDFSSPEGTKSAIAMQKPLVCGTTGLSEEHMQMLYELSTKVPVLYSPNFSLGMALCFEMCEFFHKRMKQWSSISIEETHHVQKADIPSGTAKKMGELLGVDTIISHREGETIGIHQVDFFLENEKISLRHEACSRKVFAKGALLAAKFLYPQPPKFYTLRDLFICNEYMVDA